MRSLVIDTDTASDDAVALLLAARSPDVCIRMVTTVAGNTPLQLCTRNAIVTLDLVGLGAVEVHQGLDRPLLRSLETAQDVHGADGMGGAELLAPSRGPSAEHAVDALRRIARDEPGQHVLVTLGPLTNIAAALILDPDLLTAFQHTYAMAGAFDGVGNVSGLGEYNVWADPEAADLFLQAPGDKTYIGWDVSRRYAVMRPDEQARLAEAGRLGRFVVDINRDVDHYARTVSGLEGFDLPDPIAMAVAVDPTIVRRFGEHHVSIGHGRASRGGTIIDHRHDAPPPNARVVWEVDEARFKQMLLDACTD